MNKDMSTPQQEGPMPTGDELKKLRKREQRVEHGSITRFRAADLANCVATVHSGSRPIRRTRTCARLACP